MRRFLAKIYEYWMSFGHAIGLVMTPVWLLLIYIVVFGPSRLATTAFRRDPLNRSFGVEASFWTPREPHTDSLDEARHQF
ncbi:MAG TPA: SxtJ family membrane protein [Candidatus Polarisedimenticolia bacterium]|nr:SxtJ family membrane protein [Candidatus Polarisedimenticolia bacterium]